MEQDPQAPQETPCLVVVASYARALREGRTLVADRHIVPIKVVRVGDRDA